MPELRMKLHDNYHQHVWRRAHTPNELARIKTRPNNCNSSYNSFVHHSLYMINLHYFRGKSTGCSCCRSRRKKSDCTKFEFCTSQFNSKKILHLPIGELLKSKKEQYICTSRQMKSIKLCSTAVLERVSSMRSLILSNTIGMQKKPPVKSIISTYGS